MNFHFDIHKFLANRQKNLKATVIIVLVVVAFFMFFFGNHNKEEAVQLKETSSDAKVTNEVQENGVFVDVSGAVKKPSVLELPPGSRIKDAIDAAGGLTSDADISQINRAAQVEDGQKIFIPEQSEATQQGTSEIRGNQQGNGKINLNTADADSLESVPGIGPSTAQKILDFRQEMGLFTKLEELMEVNGIGEKTYEKLKEYFYI